MKKGQTNSESVRIKIEPQELGLKNGKAMLRILAADYSWKSWGNGNRTNFKSKEDLYASLSLRVLQYLSLRIEQISFEKEVGADPLANLEKLIDAMYDVYEFDPISIIKVIHLQSRKILNNLSPQLLLEFNVLSKKSINTIAGIFEHGIKQGVIIDRHPVALADIFWSLFSGIVLWETSKKKLIIKKTI